MESNWKYVKEFASLSTSLPSGSPKNEKLTAFLNRKSADQKLVVMKNRINRLEKLKLKALNEVEQLKKEISFEHNMKNEKNDRAERKRRFSQENFELLEKKKQENFKFRLENKRKIQYLTGEMLKEKQKSIQEYKDKVLGLKDELKRNKSKDFQQKFANCKKMKTGYVVSLRERCNTQRRYRRMVSLQYENSIDQERQLENEADSKIAELEKNETSLIEELSRTIELQKDLKSTLRRLKTSIYQTN